MPLAPSLFIFTLSSHPRSGGVHAVRGYPRSHRFGWDGTSCTPCTMMRLAPRLYVQPCRLRVQSRSVKHGRDLGKVAPKDESSIRKERGPWRPSAAAEKWTTVTGQNTDELLGHLSRRGKKARKAVKLEPQDERVLLYIVGASGVLFALAGTAHLAGLGMLVWLAPIANIAAIGAINATFAPPTLFSSINALLGVGLALSGGFACYLERCEPTEQMTWLGLGFLAQTGLVAGQAFL
eukprot:Sspe_Gene.97705::Locus_71253_Transcript_1_1_Confidence_1.000_Length_1434::g.97705::m.97705